jgi:hypothetical protein
MPDLVEDQIRAEQQGRQERPVSAYEFHQVGDHCGRGAVAPLPGGTDARDRRQVIAGPVCERGSVPSFLVVGPVPADRLVDAAAQPGLEFS